MKERERESVEEEQAERKEASEREKFRGIKGESEKQKER